MPSVSLALAFVAGVLSFLSPCILPLIPAYLSYLTGQAIAEGLSPKAKSFLLLQAVGFVVGFSIVFITMGAAASTLGQLFAEYQHIFRRLAGVFIIIMGIHLTGILKIAWLYREKRFLPLVQKSKAGSILLGMAFAAGWTPCIGPILSSILFYAGSLDTIWQGVLLLTSYSLGMAVPFLLAALLIQRFTLLLERFKKHLTVISVISGILLIITGLLIYTDQLSVLGGYLDFNLFDL